MAVVGNWTYSGDPRDSARDAVRYLVQDTDEANKLIGDEEIAYELSTTGSNVFKAAANVCETVATTLGREVTSKSVGGLSLSYAARSQEFRDRAAALRRRASRSSALAVYSGGISKLDKEVQEADSDWDRPWFEREQYDHHGSKYDRNRYYELDE